MKGAKLARQATLSLVVQPLLAWYALAGVLAFDHTEGYRVRQATKDLVNACPRFFGRESIVRHLNAIRNGKPIPANAPRMLRDFAAQIETAARLPFASWAILDALVYAWSPSIRQDPHAAVAQWLASAPLDRLPVSQDAERFDADLGALARLFDFHPSSRLRLGERLVKVRPDASSSLSRHGFISLKEARNE